MRRVVSNTFVSYFLLTNWCQIATTSTTKTRSWCMHMSCVANTVNSQSIICFCCLPTTQSLGSPQNVTRPWPSPLFPSALFPSPNNAALCTALLSICAEGDEVRLVWWLVCACLQMLFLCMHGKAGGSACGINDHNIIAACFHARQCVMNCATIDFGWGLVFVSLWIANCLFIHCYVMLKTLTLVCCCC